MKEIFPYLSCFTTVCSTRNISEAAKALGIKQPSASRQIRELETLLGVALFVRERHGVKLTKAGQQLADQVLPLVGQLSIAVDVISGSGNKIDGLIRIGCLTEVGQSFLLPRLLGFRNDYPSVDLQIELLKEAEIKEKLRAGDLDFGIVTNVMSSEKLASEVLMNERIVLVSRSTFQHKLETIKDLHELQFVTYRPEDPLLLAWISSRFGRINRSKIHQPMTVNSHRSMIDCLKAFDAFAVMPWHSVAHLVNAGVLRVASRHELQGSLHLAWVPSPNERRRRAVLRNFLLDCT
jgi:DNA-binding transcriptional LysR family regulator